MGMPHPTELAGERWTPDRVWAELVQEDQAWPRYELLEGELVVTPAPKSYDHQRVIRGLLLRLHAYLEREPVGEVLFAPADIRLDPASTTQPDLFVLSVGRGVTGLLLACEALSPGSRRHDRVRKRRYYAARGVADYWVVDAESRLFERNGPDERVTVHEETLLWHPAGAREPFVLDVPAFFAEELDAWPASPGASEPGGEASGDG